MSFPRVRADVREDTSLKQESCVRNWIFRSYQKEVIKMCRDNERLMKGVDREIEVDDKLELIGAIGASLFAVVFTFGMFFLWLMGVG